MATAGTLASIALLLPPPPITGNLDPATSAAIAVENGRIAIYPTTIAI